MGDGALSQDDIDSLLGGSFDDMAASPETKTEGAKDQAASEETASLDALTAEPAPGSAPAGSNAIFDDLDSLIGGGSDTPQPDQKGGATAKTTTAPSPESIDISKQGNLPILINVYIDIHVELGKKSLMIKDILLLGEGSIIELDKAAGEPVDILANNRPMARGEVVVVDEQFGVRVTDMVDPRKEY